MDNFIMFLSFINTLVADGGTRIIRATGFAPTRLELAVHRDHRIVVRGKDSPPSARVFVVFNPEYAWDGSFSPAQTSVAGVGEIDLRHDRFCECSGCTCTSPSFSDEGWDL